MLMASDIDVALLPATKQRMEKSALSDFVLTRIASGDPEAVEDCLKKYGALIWSIVKRMTRDNAEAEDAVQEIFIELWQVANRFDPAKASESTFITMLTRRRLIDRIRKTKTGFGRLPLGPENADRIAVPEVNCLEVADESAKAVACFEKLTENAQTVLKLSIHQGHSHSEIATQLSLPLGSVKSFARRGLLQLRDCMSRPLVPHAMGAAT